MNANKHSSRDVAAASGPLSEGHCGYWLYCKNLSPTFDQRFFDDRWLAENNHVNNRASAGRGGTYFLELDQHSLVLRHYRRGGFMRSFSDDRYVWQGLKHTRAWREFHVLCTLERLNLPAPRPFACEVRRHGATYSASMLSYFIPGETLAQRIYNEPPSSSDWQAIGRCIRTFHDAGVNHADLNAHNILMGGHGTGNDTIGNERTSKNTIGHKHAVSLIDFDRAKIQTGLNGTWRKSNLARLKRSLDKIVASDPVQLSTESWPDLMLGYSQT